jgi:ATP-binding cassette subfamily B protein
MPLLQQIYHAWPNVQGNGAMFVGVVELLRRPIPKRFRVDSAPVEMQKGLALDRVSFRYGSNNPIVLHEISLEIPRGSRVGFVGKSGSGKSTLMDLVMGLLQPVSGAIKIDGVPLNEGNVVAWQRHIAHVSQHIFLADATITANVALGVRPQDIDEARVREACRLAELDAFAASLPEGYATVVGEKGIRLSGGQRQRIGVARALYKRASVLFLDEATSALDDDTEAAIMRSVQNLGPNYTVLMIAHRVTTLRGCDVIYRLDSGRLIDQGSYSEVIGSGLPVDMVAARA